MQNNVCLYLYQFLCLVWVEILQQFFHSAAMFLNEPTLTLRQVPDFLCFPPVSSFTYYSFENVDLRKLLYQSSQISNLIPSRKTRTMPGDRLFWNNAKHVQTHRHDRQRFQFPVLFKIQMSMWRSLSARIQERWSEYIQEHRVDFDRAASGHWSFDVMLQMKCTAPYILTHVWI